MVGTRKIKQDTTVHRPLRVRKITESPYPKVNHLGTGGRQPLFFLRVPAAAHGKRR